MAMNWWSSVKSWFRGEVKADPTYGITAQYYTPGEPIWSDKNYHSFVTQGYKKCGAVYACTNKIAQGAAGIRWKLYTDKSMQRTIGSHALLDLWDHPNPQMGASELVEQLFGFQHLAGNAYLYASRLKPTEPPVELWPLYPDQMKIVAGAMTAGPQGYVYGYGGPHPRTFALEDIMHLKFPSYDERSLYGLSPLEVAMRKVDSLNTSAEYGIALKQNYGSPSALFTAKSYLTVDQRNQVKSELRKKFSGKRNAGMPLVIEADMNYQQMSLSPKEMDWLASDQVDERGICMILDVPSILLSDYEGATYANRKEAKQSLFTENILPKLDKMVGHLNMWLVPMFDDLRRSGAYFSYDPKDIEVLAELYTGVEKQFKDNAVSLYNTGGCTLRYLQQAQGMEPKQSTYLDVYKVGPGIYIREEDLEEYAVACLEKAGSAPPPMIAQSTPPPALPAPSSPGQPGQTTVTEVPPDDDGNSPDGTQKRRAHRHAVTIATKVLDLATKEDKAAYMQSLEAQRAIWEATIEQRLQTYFKEEQCLLAKSLETCSTPEQAEQAVEAVLTSQEDTLQQLLYNAWHDTGAHFATETAKQLEAAKTATLADIFTSQVISYLLTLAATKVTQITDTTREQIKTALAAGVQAGEGIPQLAKRLQTLYGEQIIPNRSKTIARTEVVSASNYAAIEGAKSSGLTLNKVWLATEDSETRPDHADADEQEVGMDESFVVGGVEMDRPGDGPADQVINCRCTVYFKRVKQTEKVVVWQDNNRIWERMRVAV